MPHTESAHSLPPVARPGLMPAVNVAMAAVVVFTAISGIVSLRRSRSAAGQSAIAGVERKRLLRYLGHDLRRAAVPPAMDPDDKGIQIAVPDASGPDKKGGGKRAVAYRFLNGSITRTDPWLPRVRNDSGVLVDSGPVTIASDMAAFPTILADPADGAGSIPRYRVTLHSAFRSVAGTDGEAIIAMPAAKAVRGKASGM